MDSSIANTLSSINCNIKNQASKLGAIQYDERLYNIGGASQFILENGSVSYTIVVGSGEVSVHGGTLSEGSWTYSAPAGGSFGQVLIDASSAPIVTVLAIYPQ
jgi:hypothetical protein